MGILRAMSKGNEPTRKHGGRMTSTTYPELHAGLELQLLKLRKMVRREGQRLVAQAHILDAVMAWLLTRSEAEQVAVLAEGKRLVTILEALETDGEPLMPGTYRASSGAVKGRRGGGRDTTGHPTTVEDIIDGKPARGAGGKQKRPKAKGAPVPSVGE